jgi:hypothetical protein
MTIVYDNNTTIAFVDKIRQSYPTQSNNRIVIYKGTMPAANAWSEAGSSADELVRFENFTLSDNGYMLFFGVTPVINPVNATASGTAAWAAIFQTLSPEYNITVSVTNAAGTGGVKVDDTNITSGNPVTVTSVGISLGVVY